MVLDGEGGLESGDGDTAVVASENGEISIACDDSSALSGAEALTSSLILQRPFWLLQTQEGKPQWHVTILALCLSNKAFKNTVTLPSNLNPAQLLNNLAAVYGH